MIGQFLRPQSQPQILDVFQIFSHNINVFIFLDAEIIIQFITNPHFKMTSADRAAVSPECT